MVSVYPKGKERLVFGTYNLNPATTSGHFKIILLKSGAAFNPAHLTLQDVVTSGGGCEFPVGGAGNGYGRVALSSMTLTIVGSYVIYTSNPVTFSSLVTGYTVVAALLAWNASGVDSSSYPIAWFDGGSYPNDLPKDTTGGDLVVSPHPSDGWLKI